MGWTDHALEDAGRLTHPLRYNADTDHYEVISYQEAFARAGTVLRGLDHPDQAEFYTSGRTSNEGGVPVAAVCAHLWDQQLS